jgi:hypothetical protein
MPYLNKRNRFIQAAKTHAESNGIKADEFKKSDLLAVANSINMKGIPTWVLKECKSSVSHRTYDLTPLFNSTTASV